LQQDTYSIIARFWICWYHRDACSKRAFYKLKRIDTEKERFTVYAAVSWLVLADSTETNKSKI